MKRLFVSLASLLLLLGAIGCHHCHGHRGFCDVGGWDAPQGCGDGCDGWSPGVPMLTGMFSGGNDCCGYGVPGGGMAMPTYGTPVSNGVFDGFGSFGAPAPIMGMPGPMMAGPMVPAPHFAPGMNAGCNCNVGGAPLTFAPGQTPPASNPAPVPDPRMSIPQPTTPMSPMPPVRKPAPAPGIEPTSMFLPAPSSSAAYQTMSIQPTAYQTMNIQPAAYQTHPMTAPSVPTGNRTASFTTFAP